MKPIGYEYVMSEKTGVLFLNVPLLVEKLGFLVPTHVDELR